MKRSNTIVVSDTHLGAAPEENERSFLKFLEEIPDRSRDLLINGDLFDFWFEYETVILSRHFPVLRRLVELVEAGVRIRLVGGNHDSWGGRFLRDDIGIELVLGPLTTLIGGMRAYVAHGDGIGGGDWGYRILRSVTRSRPARSAFRHVHPDWSAYLVRGISRTQNRGEQGNEAGNPERAARLSTLADTILAEQSEIELVIFGHAHVPELREVEPGRFYLTSGDWLHPCTWAEVSPGRVSLNRWNPR
jgi:UDP-2,3-diacylglucosamine hydrolase